jgi:hypothetical protein
LRDAAVYYKDRHMDVANPLLIVVLAAAVIFMMTVLGIDRSALEWKRDLSVCRSCGRQGDDCRCPR